MTYDIKIEQKINGDFIYSIDGLYFESEYFLSKVEAEKAAEKKKALIQYCQMFNR